MSPEFLHRTSTRPKRHEGDRLVSVGKNQLELKNVFYDCGESLKQREEKASDSSLTGLLRFEGMSASVVRLPPPASRLRVSGRSRIAVGGPELSGRIRENRD